MGTHVVIDTRQSFVKIIGMRVIMTYDADTLVRREDFVKHFRPSPSILRSWIPQNCSGVKGEVCRGCRVMEGQNPPPPFPHAPSDSPTG